MATILSDSIKVIDGSGIDIRVIGDGPSEVRDGRMYNLDLLYGNDGDLDTMAPLILIENPGGTSLGFTPNERFADQYMQIIGGSGDGPLDVLRPGAFSSATVYFVGGGGIDLAVLHDRTQRSNRNHGSAMGIHRTVCTTRRHCRRGVG